MEIMGVKFRQLPDPSENARFDDLYSGIGYLQYVHRYHGRHIRQLLNEYGNDSFLVRVRFYNSYFNDVLHLVFYYQIRSICVHHLTIAAYFGYNVKGGALEVGKASTNAVVMSSIMILLADVILTHLMLT